MERTALREIIPDESRLVFDHIPPEFLSDTLGRRKGEASALVFAKSTEEVSKLLQYAHANRIPVTPRGAAPTWLAPPCRWMEASSWICPR